MAYTYLVWYTWCHRVGWFWRRRDCCHTWSWRVTVLLFASYPCPSHNSGWFWWYWMSEKIPDNKRQKEITFRWEMDDLRRVKYWFVTFMTTPKEF